MEKIYTMVPIEFMEGLQEIMTRQLVELDNLHDQIDRLEKKVKVLDGFAHKDLPIDDDFAYRLLP